MLSPPHYAGAAAYSGVHLWIGLPIVLFVFFFSSIIIINRKFRFQLPFCVQMHAYRFDRAKRSLKGAERLGVFSFTHFFVAIIYCPLYAARTCACVISSLRSSGSCGSHHHRAHIAELFRDIVFLRNCRDPDTVVAALCTRCDRTLRAFTSVSRLICSFAYHCNKWAY